MNVLLVSLNTILLVLSIVVLGVSSAAIDKLKKEETKDNSKLIAYWYATLGVTIAMILVIVFMLMASLAMFMGRDTYLE